MTKLNRVRQFTILVLLVLPVAEVAGAEEVLVREARFRGAAATGLNEILGRPARDYGPPLGTFFFTTVGGYDPSCTKAFALSEDTPGSTVLATTVDPLVLELFGITLHDLDPGVLNVPLQDVPTIVDAAGTRGSLRSQREADPLEPGLVEPTAPITLDDWLEANGSALVRCPEGRSATISLTMRDLLPNRLFTVWAIYATAGGSVAARPLGGVPNTFTTDGNGNASFARKLYGCPLDPDPEGNQMVAIDILFHSDHLVYGSQPSVTYLGLPSGVIGHVQLEFGMVGTPIE